MAEDRRRKERTWEEINDISKEEYWKANEPMGRGDSATPNMVCKTCKFSQKRFDGKELTGRLNPKYMAGTCEKYEDKPSKVYFDGEKCPKYEAK